MTAQPASGRAGAVPLVDLGRLDEALLWEAERVFGRLARAGAFVLGEELEAFEREFAAYCGVGECVGVSDGTDAIRLALQAIGTGPGTEVVTVPLTFIATVEAIAMAGARPVLVDVDPETRCLDPRGLADAVSENTAAVIPVHLYGRPAAMDEIVDACNGVPVIEDAAQAHGATIGGRRAGSFGAAGCFSFYPTKNLGAMGDGGAVVCDDGALAATIRSLRHHGAAEGDANRHLRLGSTARLDNVQAAILRLKLRHLDAWNDERRALAARYREALNGLPLSLPPLEPDGWSQVYHLFVIEVDDRDRVRARLGERGIGAGIHYPTPVHLQPAWNHLGYGRGDFPHAERLCERILSLPIFPGMTSDEVSRVAAALGHALS